MIAEEDTKDRFAEDLARARRSEPPSSLRDATHAAERRGLTRGHVAKTSRPPEEDPYADVPCTD
jgi:hypothetical protein